MTERRRSTSLRALAVLVAGGVAFAALAAAPAAAGKFITKKRAMRLFLTKGEASKFITKQDASKFIAEPVQYVRSDPATIQPSGPDAHVFKGVLCPPGTIAIGGGGVSSAINMAMEQSFPWGGDLAGQTAGNAGWGVRYDNDTQTAQTIRAYAMCLDSEAAAGFPLGAPLI